MVQYYIRLRGQISGPYSVGQLQNLRARSQLGRFHEVSEDQEHWAPAGSIAELFPGGAQRTPANAMPMTPPPVRPLPLPLPAAEDTIAEWYYLNESDQQQGPVSMQGLQALLDAGQVKANTFVCKQGLPEWQLLDTLPYLLLSSPGDLGPDGRWQSAPEQDGEQALAPPTLVLGIILGLLAGLVAAATAVYLAAESFRSDEAGAGLAYLLLLAIALGLTGGGVYGLVAELKQPLGREEMLRGESQ